MPTQYVPINGEVLQWALDQSGLRLDQLAGQVNVPPAELEDWINGDSKPSKTKFNDLAKALHRSPSFLLRPRVPVQAETRVSLRIPYGATGRREPTPVERLEIRKAQRRQKIARWAAAQKVDFTPPNLPQPGSSPELSAEVARGWLNWTVKDQLGAANKSAVTKDIRLRLEQHGILVLQLSMGVNSCRGFSLYDNAVPLIAVNGQGQIASARSFTLLHELAHLMFREQAVCDSSDEAHERWCDRFAAAFLMPADDLWWYVKSVLRLSYVGPKDIDSIGKLSEHYKVSYLSVALRLWALNLADFALYEYVRAEGWKKEDGSAWGRGGQTTPVVRLRQYGTLYPKLLLDCYRSGIVSEIDVRKHLEVNGSQLKELVSLLAGAE
ncbi:ImmA/IrrE family metallo-endopeptidase [Lentzea sp. NPDC004789]